MLHCFYSVLSPGGLKNDHEMKPKISPGTSCKDNHRAGQVQCLQRDRAQTESPSDFCFSKRIRGIALSLIHWYGSSTQDL